MLDRARELMRSGARDAARDMLAQLQEMLENLRAGTQQAQPSQGEQNLSDLQKMIQLQQQLLERSFNMDRGQRQGEQRARAGSSEGQQQRGSKASRASRASRGRRVSRARTRLGQSAAEQESLRRALGELMRRMGEAGMEIPRALGQAEMQMRDARGSLQQGQPGDAANAQSQAVDSMQRAGQAMMEQMQEQMARQQGEGPGWPAAAEWPPRPRSRWAVPRATTAAWTPAGSRYPRRAIWAGRATCSRSSTAGPATATGRPSSSTTTGGSWTGSSPCAWSSARRPTATTGPKAHRSTCWCCTIPACRRPTAALDRLSIPRPRSAPTT